MDSPRYARTTGSARGEARRADLLARVTDDIAEHGLVDFSLRRAAKAANTTHKVLLYYFDGPEDLLTQAVLRLRARRIDRAIAAGLDVAPDVPLSERVRALWPVLTAPDSWVLDQAIGLAMFDPDNYAELAATASAEYLPPLVAMCPVEWPEDRKSDVAHLVLGALRGFLLDWRTRGSTDGVEAGYRALLRALEREENA